MKLSYFKSKLSQLKSLDLVKFITDLTLPDIELIGDYNPSMSYKKGERVYYYDIVENKHKVLEAFVDVEPGEFIAKDWEVIQGTHNHNNKDIIDGIGVNEAGRLTYDNKIVGSSVICSIEKPEMINGDLWFSIGNVDITPEPEPPHGFCDKIVFKNLKMQDDEPESKEDIWGDSNNNK